jgi:putative nucleotidyltransferase with HDIG domain
MAAPAAPAKSTVRPTNRLVLARAGLIALLTVLALWLAMVANVLPRPLTLREGDVSPFDLHSPIKATYVSQVRTKQDRERAANAVSPVYEITINLVNGQRKAQTAFLQSIATARDQNNASLGEKAATIARLGDPPLGDALAGQIVSIDDRRWLVVASEAQRLLQDVMKDRLSEPAVAQVVRELPLRVRDQLTDVERTLAVELTTPFVRPNLEVNEGETERLRQEAREAVPQVDVSVERGETVLRAGQVVGAADVEELEALGLLNPSLDWRTLLAAALLSFASVLAIGVYVLVFEPGLLRRERPLILVALVLLVIVVGAKIVLPARPLWMYVFPLPAVAMLLADLLEARLAIVVTAVGSMLVGWLLGNSLEMAALGTLGGVVGASGVWRRERLNAHFLTGVLVGLTQVAVVAAFFLVARRDDWPILVVTSFEALLNGVLSALLAIGLVYLLGSLFGITTRLQLLELANPTQPLLRRLLMEAPGTYHHSIMVGNLGERAAEEIGADSLLVRVAAYYHDVGKLRRPYFFVENQANATNPHESLSPRTSARIIAAHISDGLELAAQYRLPARIRELIPQHHGTRLISFFYQQAAEHDPQADAAQFTYPGPRPQSKEAAILMLADSIEAAARASKDHSQVALAQLVNRIVMQRVEEGQFDECPLTLSDLNGIKRAFCTLLLGIYHPRIEYPQPLEPTSQPRPASDVAPSGDVPRA